MIIKRPPKGYDRMNIMKIKPKKNKIGRGAHFLRSYVPINRGFKIGIEHQGNNKYL